MSALYTLSADERKKFFEVAAYESQKSLEIIEKDYWVVWILERLFSLPDLKSHLTFKGGTSLSKIYSLIERFSEDVDISIEQVFLGFDEKKDPSKLSSRSKQKSLLEDLIESCSKYVQGKMLQDLKNNIKAKLETDQKWRVVVDPDDSQTLLFEYPNVSQADGYIRPFIKIEMGARAEHWPVSEYKVHSYAKEILKEKINEQQVIVRVLNAERTFWEKATILHQYANLPNDKILPSRISRHYYDFFKLLKSEIKEKALQNAELLERVANHKKIYFASTWADYDSARKGTLKLLPPKRIIDDLKRDYALMKDMFFGEIPEWKLVLKTIEEFETEFNVKA